jgi:Family of unknown function (DUF5947)
MTLGALRRFADQPAPRAGERCEMCARPIEEEHSHIVDVEARRLLCACRPCYLLFTQPGSAHGRLRAVPDRSRYAPLFRIDDASWAALQIPVRTAFFFPSSQAGRFMAFYPSPAGATESLLELSAWDEIVRSNPMLESLLPDVEALLVHGRRGRGFDCFLVPIDVCYELVGRVRQTWRGFDGGEEAWREIDAFFAALRERSAEVREPDTPGTTAEPGMIAPGMAAPGMAAPDEPGDDAP